MSDIRQAGGALIGAAIGFVVGGPLGAVQGASLGLTIGTAFTTTTLDPVTGPRIEDKTFTQSSYGEFVPRTYGINRLGGNVIWLENNEIKETRNVETVRQGGKGGGGTEQRVTTFTYSASFTVAFCEGPVDEVLRLWADNILIYDASGDSSVVNIADNTEIYKNIKINTGSFDQEPSDLAEETEGTNNVPAYRGLCTVEFEEFQLEKFGNRIPGITAEIVRLDVLSTVNFVGAASYYTSNDGIDWLKRGEFDTNFNVCRYANSKWVACADDKVYTSADGINWSETLEDTTTKFIDIAYGGNNTWMVVGGGPGQSNEIYISTDNANTWTVFTDFSGFTTILTSCGSDGAGTFAVLDNNKNIGFNDGSSTLTATGIPGSGSFNNAAVIRYENNRWLAQLNLNGFSYAVAESTDQVNWTIYTGIGRFDEIDYVPSTNTYFFSGIDLWYSNDNLSSFTQLVGGLTFSAGEYSPSDGKFYVNGGVGGTNNVYTATDETDLTLVSSTNVLFSQLALRDNAIFGSTSTDILRILNSFAGLKAPSLNTATDSTDYTFKYWYYNSGTINFIKSKSVSSRTFFDPFNRLFSQLYSNYRDLIWTSYDPDDLENTIRNEVRISIKPEQFFNGINGYTKNENFFFLPVPNSVNWVMFSWQGQDNVYYTGVGYVDGAGKVSIYRCSSLTNIQFTNTAEPRCVFLEGFIYIYLPNAWDVGKLSGVHVVDVRGLTPTYTRIDDTGEGSDGSEIDTHLSVIASRVINSQEITTVLPLEMGVDPASGNLYSIQTTTGSDRTLNVLTPETLVIENSISLSVTTSSQGYFGASNDSVYISTGTNLVSQLDLDLTNNTVTETTVNIGIDEVNTYHVSNDLILYHDEPYVDSISGAFGAGYLTTRSVGSLFEIENSAVLRNELATLDLLNIQRDCNFSELTISSMKGFTVGSLSSVISTTNPVILREPFDIIEEDYQIKFKSRLPGTVATIENTDLRAHEADSTVPDESVRQIPANYELPFRIEVNYIDGDRQYEQGVQYAENLQFFNNTQIKTVDAQQVLTAEQAAQLADKILSQEILNSRGTVDFTTHWEFSYLAPSDVIQLNNVGGESFELFISEIDKGKPGLVKIKGIINDSSILDSDATAEAPPVNVESIAPILPTEIIPMDLPALREADLDTDGYYYAVYSQEPSWGGAIVGQSPGGVAWTTKGAIFAQATVGRAINTLTEGISTIFDNTQTLSVAPLQGTFSSATEDEVRASEANVLAYGDVGRWEIIKFQTATLEGDGTYTLSKLVRGYYNTEFYMGSHLEGDLVVLLNEEALRREIQTTATVNIEIGSPYDGNAASVQVPVQRSLPQSLWRAVTFGTQAERARSVNIRPAQANKWRQVYHTKIYRDSARDITIEWIYSNPIVRELIDETDNNFGGAAERTYVDILDSNGNGIRRIFVDEDLLGSGLQNPETRTATYTATQQTTDFGSIQNEITCVIYVRTTDKVRLGTTVTG